MLEKKSQESNLSVPDEVIHLLAKNLTRDVRQLESALSCLKAKSELMNVKITKKLAKEVIQCHNTDATPLTLDEIKLLLSKYFKIDPLMLESKSRKKIHALPRSIFVYLSRRFTDATLQDIGKAINRNHSTVLYASEMIAHKMKIDRSVKKEVDFLTKKLEERTK
jgi:chromosomal replication initiator protein